MSNCYKCSKPLGPDADEFGRTLCHDCRGCDTCHLMLSPAETRYISENALTYVRCAECICLTEPLGKVQTVHPSDDQNISIIGKDETVTISKATYDRLNLARQLCTPLTGMSNETNQQAAIIDNRKWLDDKSIEDVILHMRRMQAVAADCKVLALQRLNKEKRTLEQVERDINRSRNTELDRTLAEERKRANAKAEDAAEKNLSPLERKKRREREKNIRQMMTFTGESYEQATKTYDRLQSINKVMQEQKLNRAAAEAIVDAPGYGVIQ